MPGSLREWRKHVCTCLAARWFPHRNLAAAVSQRAAALLALTAQLEHMQCCCTSPKTGFYRDGFCNTGPNDAGAHVVCSRVTKEFLEYSASRGNNLMQAYPPSFPGLKPGDRCLLS